MTRPAPEPRGLSRARAAGYLDISVGLFDQMVEDGRMPTPKLINRRKVWDRFAIDDAFERLPGSEPENPWDTEQ